MSKCIKFENGLHPQIKQYIGYQEIHQFSMMVNKCRIYDEDRRARSSHYKSVSDKRMGNQNREKHYVVLNGKGKQRFQQKNNGGESHSGGGVSSTLQYLKCGVHDHRSSERTTLICFNCGKAWHKAAE